jgi:hypothetical protein
MGKGRKIRELEAQILSAYWSADSALDGVVMEKMLGSGVLVTLSALGGREIVRGVVIRDGLSESTVEALRADIRRSYAQATEMKPRGVK